MRVPLTWHRICPLLLINVLTATFLLNVCSADEQPPNQPSPAAEPGSASVLIYKGPQPWAPLARARAFGLRINTPTEGLEEEAPVPVPVQAAETISEQQAEGAETQVEGSGEEQPQQPLAAAEVPDYIDQDQGLGKNIRADLHASLRQPLKRLSDRQLALLLKQIRKQRRKQQQQHQQQQKQKQQPAGREEEEETGKEKAEEEEQEGQPTRKEMLRELRQLLRTPPGGQRLLRPKLLTNINIVPNEWNIYPAKRLVELEQQEASENGTGLAKLADEQPSQQQQQNGSDDQQTSNSSSNGGQLAEGETARDEQQQRGGQGEMGESKQENAEQGQAEEEADPSTAVPLPSSGQASETTTATITASETTENDVSSTTPELTTSTTTTTTTTAAVRWHSVDFAPLEEQPAADGNGIDNSIALPAAENGRKAEEEEAATLTSSNQNQTSDQTPQQPSAAELPKQHLEEEGEPPNSEERKADERIAKLSARWRVVEQKFAAEMKSAVLNASQAIAQAEKQIQQQQQSGENNGSNNGGNSSNSNNSSVNPAGSIEELQRKKENNTNLSSASLSSSILFSAKTWEPIKGRSVGLNGTQQSEDEDAIITSGSESTDNGTLSSSSPSPSSLADLERAQLAELSTQLREIRIRYEAVKRQFVAKLRLLNAKRTSKRLNKHKAAGTATFVDGADLELKGNGTEAEEEKKEETIGKFEEEASEDDQQKRKQQLRLEELRKEEELAKKVLSGEVDEEKEQQTSRKHDGLLETSPAAANSTTGIVLITEAPRDSNRTETEGTSSSTEANTNPPELPADLPAENATTQGEGQSVNRSNILLPVKKEEEKNATKQLPRKKLMKPKKMPTLAELAEELSRLDERQIGLRNDEQQLGNGTEERREDNKERQQPKGLKLSEKQKGGAAKKQAQKAVKVPRIKPGVAKGGEHPKLIAEKQQQRRGSIPLRVGNSLPPAPSSNNNNNPPSSAILPDSAQPEESSSNSSSPENPSLIPNGQPPEAETPQNNSSSNNNASSTDLAQAEETAADLLREGGLPSTPLRVVPTPPRKRILTTDWLPKTQQLSSAEVGQENGNGTTTNSSSSRGGGGTTPPKSPAAIDAGRKKGQGGGGRMAIVVTRHRDQPNGTTTVVNSSSSIAVGVQQQPREQKLLAKKKPRLNQSVAIGARPTATNGQQRNSFSSSLAAAAAGLPQHSPPIQRQNGQQQLNGSTLGRQKQQQPEVQAILSRQQQQQQQQQQNNGFYQLDRAQVANVALKTPKPVAQGELKLKGVSQVQVEASRDQAEATADWSETQLQAKLKEELNQQGPKQQQQKDGAGKAAAGNNVQKEKKQKQQRKKEKEGGGGEESEDINNLEEFARIDEQAICDAIACNFETGSLCEWEPSKDELNPEDPRYRRYMMARHFLLSAKKMLRRRRRQATGGANDGQQAAAAQGQQPPKTGPGKQEQQQQKKRIVLRSWHNWVGRYRNRLTGIARSEIFSTRNQRFAASYVRPGQRSTLTGRLLSGEKATIRFRVWEATRDLQLRVCCDNIDKDDQCVFQTDLGIKRGSRRWLERTASCPQGTKKIIFECRNLGRFQGACGLDNIELVNDYCPTVAPAN